MKKMDQDSISRAVPREGGVKGATHPPRTRLISATTWMTIILSSMYGIMYLDRVNISMAAKDKIGRAHV